MDYIIIVNDNGELKTISATEFETGMTDKQKAAIEKMLNNILDARSQLEELDRLARAHVERALHKDDGDLPEFGGN